MCTSQTALKLSSESVDKVLVFANYADNSISQFKNLIICVDFLFNSFIITTNPITQRVLLRLHTNITSVIDGTARPSTCSGDDVWLI